MLKDNFNDLYYLTVVAQERLEIPLLTRTTRSVAPTEAGERLINTIAPRFSEIKSELTSLTEMRDRVAGNIRINLGEHALQSTV